MTFRTRREQEFVGGALAAYLAGINFTIVRAVAQQNRGELGMPAESPELLEEMRRREVDYIPQADRA